MIPFINVTDITAVPLVAVYRFWGTGLTAAIGGDFTGRSPTDVPPRAIGLSARGGCGRLVKEKVPHCELKQFQTLRRVTILRVLCSNDG
ncbi:MAG: hypothetical protein VW268_09250 [Rhodospirillaceae bacterium]